MTATDVLDVTGFCRTVFTLLMGLALAEAFRQFAAAPAGAAPARRLAWDRLPALLSLLVLILPFYQGMSRYFFLTYGRVEAMPHPYAAFLCFDSVNFLVESALFFIMTQALPAASWRRFSGAVLTLLMVDCVWVGMSTWLHASPIEPWMLVNIGASAVLLGVLIGVPRQAPPLTVAIGVLLLVLCRSGLDYALSWSFYFP